MSSLNRCRRTSALAVAVVLLSGVLAPAAHADDDAPPSGFPSWQDVQAAKSSQSAKTAEITKINGLLRQLREQSEQLGETAVRAEGDYASAYQDLQQAQGRVEVLQSQVRDATGVAERFRKETGQLAAQAYKFGSTDLAGLEQLTTLQPRRLGDSAILSVVTERTAARFAQASQAQKSATALQEQQQSAVAERERLSQLAESRKQAAADAKTDMDVRLATQNKQSSVLTAQLASLKNTTVAVETRYQQGQQALAAYEAAQQARRQAAEEAARLQAQRAAEQAAAEQAAAEEARRRAAEQQNQAPWVPAQPAPNLPPAITPPPEVTPEPVTPPPPVGGAVNDPSGAQAYAGSVLGSFGWGQDQMGCLVNLWNKESSWLTTATNPSSGAYGIAQALPAGKYASAGADWMSNYRTQIRWGLGYIKDRYGSPCGAWGHSMQFNWY